MSGRKNTLPVFQMVTNGDMSSTITSVPVNVLNMDNAGFEITYTGTPTGTFQVLGSVSGINYYPLTFNPALSAPSGAAGGFLINLNQFPYVYYQLQYISNSGSGTLNVYTTAKQV